MNFKNKIRTLFGYDVITDVKKRKQSSGVIKSEDDELKPHNRRKIISSSQDQIRNFSIAGWMIRKHLDYVSRFYFQAQTENDDLNEYMEELFNDWSRAINCDIARRHNLRGLMRLFESHKIIDGDAGLIKINNGKLQGLEGSRIAKPTTGIPISYQKSITAQGLILNRWGAVEKYVINKRNSSGSLEYDRLVDYNNMFFDGYFGRFDQTRGISPFVTALASLQDCREAIEYQLIKAKMHAMFGVAITTEVVSDIGNGFHYSDGMAGGEPDEDTEDYEFSLKPGLKLNLKPGDKIDTIESKTPS